MGSRHSESFESGGRPIEQPEMVWRQFGTEGVTSLYIVLSMLFFPALPPPVHLHRHQQHRPLCSDRSIHGCFKILANTNRPRGPGSAKTMFPLFSTLSTPDSSICHQHQALVVAHPLRLELPVSLGGWAVGGRPDMDVARPRE